MHRLQKAMRIRYILLMIILTISLISLRISIFNYNYIQEQKSFLQTTLQDYEIVKK